MSESDRLRWISSCANLSCGEHATHLKSVMGYCDSAARAGGSGQSGCRDLQYNLGNFCTRISFLSHLLTWFWSLATTTVISNGSNDTDVETIPWPGWDGSVAEPKRQFCLTIIYSIQSGLLNSDWMPVIPGFDVAHRVDIPALRSSRKSYSAISISQVRLRSTLNCAKDQISRYKWR